MKFKRRHRFIIWYCLELLGKNCINFGNHGCMPYQCDDNFCPTLCKACKRATPSKPKAQAEAAKKHILKKYYDMLRNSWK